MKKLISALVLFFAVSSTVFATGVMLPTSEKYPKDFLKLTSTKVTVNIFGTIAQTTVYQEFLNESNDSTDAVYSFPLPPDARATEILYWYNDEVYTAILKVQEQAPNPGTGEGGVAAEVNKYIGRNGIKIYLKGIKSNSIQKIELHYISMCDYYKGKYSYKFPLNTQDFIKYPVENLQLNVNVNSNSDITSFESPDFQDYKVLNSNNNNLSIKITQPKAYLNKDFNFNYTVDHSALGVDFYSVNRDTADGHFTLFVTPQDKVPQDSVFAKRVLFVLSNSSTMIGYQLDQSIAAISHSLDQLSKNDYFNILVFNSSTYSWQTQPVKADSNNIDNAKIFLSGISISYGSDLGTAIKTCFNQIKDDSLNNTILIFTNGRSPINPKEIDSLNTFKAGIFPIGIGDNLDRARLEMTANLNYGFVTYIDPTDNISDEMLKVFNKISQPIIKNVYFEFGSAGISQTVPEKIPSTYAGSQFFIAGRYINAGQSALSIAGESINGLTAYNFKLDFSNKTDSLKFVESIWAKEMIDNIERKIEIYGETNELKTQDIALSLEYNIRCRYTAYVADYTTHPTTAIDDVKSNITIPTSYIAGNYPNPFNPSTKIRFYLDNSTSGKTKLLKIYNILGQLVALIDISTLTSGWHEVTFYGKDMFGNTLSSGIYIVALQIDNQLKNTIRINLVK